MCVCVRVCVCVCVCMCVCTHMHHLQQLIAATLLLSAAQPMGGIVNVQLKFPALPKLVVPVQDRLEMMGA